MLRVSVIMGLHCISKQDAWGKCWTQKILWEMGNQKIAE
jgi:hypothetical protein